MAGKPNDKLSDDIRTYVVQALAMYDPPSLVAQAVKKDFGVTVTRQAVEGYDPTKRAGANLAQRWKTLFAETRDGYNKGTAEVGISSRLVRLHIIQQEVNRARSMGNTPAVLSGLEQAAKEMGDAYTNARVLRGALEVSVPKGLADFYGGKDR